MLASAVAHLVQRIQQQQQAALHQQRFKIGQAGVSRAPFVAQPGQRVGLVNRVTVQRHKKREGSLPSPVALRDGRGVGGEGEGLLRIIQLQPVQQRGLAAARRAQ